MTDRRFRMMGSALIAAGGAIGSSSDVGALIALVFCILFLVDWIPPLLKEYAQSGPDKDTADEPKTEAKKDSKEEDEPEPSLKSN